MALALVPLGIPHIQIVAYVERLLAPYRLVDTIAGKQPAGFIDYWLIGGLYDGALSGSASRVQEIDLSTPPPGSGRVVGYRVPAQAYDPHQWLRNNQMAVAALPPVKEWDAAILVSAAITPDGRWHSLERAVLDGRWRTLLQDILDQHQDCWAITLQYHR